MDTDLGLNPKPFNDQKVDYIVDQDGKIDDLPLLSVDIPDKDLLQSLRNKIRDSQDYWNQADGYNLEYSRNANVRLHLGRHIDKSRLYTYQVPYVDNEIFVGTEAVVAYVTSSAPSAETFPANESQASKILAEDLAQAAEAHGEKYDIAQKIESAVRNMYLKRIGLIKLVFDPDCGEHGDIVPVVVDPENVVIDKNVRLGENPNFIAETMKASVEELCVKFPDKKEEIYRCLGIKRGTPKQLGTIVAYREVWFTYYEGEGEDAKKCEGVCWYFKDVLLDKTKNPNWLYKEEGVNVTNFLEAPQKPYIPFNYINDGSHWVDQTTPVEQAAPLQDILNKRGRQIVENADTANSTLVFRSGAITADAAQNLTGDPNQKVILDTKNDPVQSAFAEIPPHLLPNYVIDDKIDLRNTIHNILGTPAQFRGDTSNQVKTLGESNMIKGQASGRQDSLVRAVDRAMDKYFKLLIQMMKVHYTEKHYFSINGEDGEYDFIEISRQSIEDRANIKVQSGSMLPFDKQKHEMVALNLAKMGLIDPYNLYKDLGLKNADNRFDALLKWQMDASTLRDTIIDEMADRTAYIDFVQIMNGNDWDSVKPRQDADSKHILAHRKQMISDRFLQSDPERQQALIDHVQQEVNMFSMRTSLDQASQAGLLTDPTQPITPEPPMPDPMTGMMPQDPMGMMGGQGMPDQGGIPMPGGDPMAAANMPPIPGPGQPQQAGAPPAPGPQALDVASVLGAGPPVL